MNKTKLYCHLGGIVAVLIFCLLFFVAIILPMKYIGLALMVISIIVFLAMVYLAGYHYVWEKIDGL